MAIKTVKCTACEAEQAIVRENPEDTAMACVFCGEPIELPAFEEGEGMEYSYDEATQEKEPDWEPVGDAITATFVLNEQEVGDAFLLSGKLKERKWILYLETALLAVFGIVMLVSSILGLLNVGGFKAPQLINWVYVVLCFGMLPVIWLMPKREKKRRIRAATSGNQLTLTIYENLMVVHVDGHDPEDDWQLHFDGSFGVIQEGGLFILTLQSGQILVLPERSLTDGQIETVKARLNAKPECAQ